MRNSEQIKCDILIAGAGFSGSLTALALHQCGFDVCLVERGIHPRFAIGESSTPVADIILRNLAEKYDLPWLYHFSRYGSWQNHYPNITCGIKRGFSYYKHFPGKPFSSNRNHSNELLVAASTSDQQSDTNWLRSDFDAFLVEKVKEYGILYFDNTAIAGCERDTDLTFLGKTPAGPVQFRTPFFIDATGSPTLLNNLFGIGSSSQGFLTHSKALYSHFEDIPRWIEMLQKGKISTGDYPYDPDHSALHHLLEEGWMWMLRFNNNRTSIGITLDMSKNSTLKRQNVRNQWDTVVNRYPSVKKLLRDARLSDEPGKIMTTGRLQRRLNKATGAGWVALPHTIGFVDPLHSTGIAHTLSGVERIVSIITDHWGKEQQIEMKLKQYESAIHRELKFIDKLVAGCYQTLDRFELFSIWTMLYFTAAITYEQKRLKGEQPDYFLSAGQEEIVKITAETYDELQSLGHKDKFKLREEDFRQFRNTVKQRIAPYNIAGLLEPEIHNMYPHTAVEM